MPEVVADLADERELREIVRRQAAQREDRVVGAAEQCRQQHGPEEARDREAHRHEEGGGDVEGRAVLHRLADAERDRDEVGDQRHPQAERDRHRQLLADQRDDGDLREIRSPEVETTVVPQHLCKTHHRRLVEAELLFELLAEGRVDPLRAAVARGEVAAAPALAGAARLHLRDHPLDRAARRKLHDDEGDEQDADDRRHHQQEAADHIGEHGVLSAGACPWPSPSPRRTTTTMRR